MNKDFIHPEKLEGEIFLINSTKKNFSSIPWPSKRLGSLAFDGQGRRIEAKDWRPTFISENELSGVRINDARRSLRERFEAR